MGYAIAHRNTAEVLTFLMVSSSDHIAGVTGLVAGVDLTVVLSKNGAAFASPTGAISEVGFGVYAIAADADDADTIGPLRLHAEGTGCDPQDDVFDVRISPASSSIEDATGGATVVDRIVLGGDPNTELAYVKTFLRVEHEADDVLLTAMIQGAKRVAVDFLNNPFEVMRSVIFVDSAVIGDAVGVDGMSFRVAADNPASREQIVALQEFAIGADDEETATNLAAIVNDSIYGAQDVLATQNVQEVSLTWRTGKLEPVTALEASDAMAVRRRRTQVPIPDPVHEGVLRTIAALYDQRQDSVSEEAVSGQGSMKYTAPPVAIRLWAPHRKLPGT